jgi:hypothetical protein
MHVFQMTAALLMILLTEIGTTTSPVRGIVLSKQTATVRGITATVTVANNRGAYAVYGMWSQEQGGHYPISCLDVYRSLKYELRDSREHAVPINQEMLRQGEPLYEGGHAVDKYKTNCSVYPPHESGILLTDLREHVFPRLYSNLPPGRYTLQLTFAPGGISQEAILKPVSITIPPK